MELSMMFGLLDMMARREYVVQKWRYLPRLFRSHGTVNAEAYDSSILTTRVNKGGSSEFGEIFGGKPYGGVTSDRYSNPMILPEPEGSTQGYPLVSVDVLRFNTTAGNPVKKILLKLNLSDHRILKDGGGDMSMSVQKLQVHKMARFIKIATRLRMVDDLKMLKITMSNTSSRNKLNPEINDHYNIFIRESQEYELKTKDEA
ncbi:hypothetical protein Tco_0217846 [Tanacetum coccineum]